MKRVLIFGTGKTSYNVINSINDDVKIVGYIDNDESKLGFKDSYQVISPDEIEKFKYDYIIIASQYEEEIFNQLREMHIDEKKVIKFFEWFDSNNNYVESVISAYHKLSNYKGIITGISYTRAAILENSLKYKFVLAAFASQDIKYDYKMVEYIINNKHNNKFDYCIIGLSYYSFQYDLSKSSMKNKVSLYNFIESYNNEGNYNLNFNVNNMIFKGNEGGGFKNFDPEIEFCKLKIEEKCKIGEKQALIDCNKNYPNTVRENKQILKDYLKLLKNNKIKPIIVVCPASKYYTKNFSRRIEAEFKTIINEIRQEYDFQYIDYFRSEQFDDDDFQDVSHLNTKGAEKFTKILNEVIEW